MVVITEREDVAVGKSYCSISVREGPLNTGAGKASEGSGGF